MGLYSTGYVAFLYDFVGWLILKRGVGGGEGEFTKGRILGI